VETLFDLKVVF